MITNLFQTYYCVFLLIFKWFYFFKSVAFRKTTRFSRKLSFFFFFLSMPKQCTGIPALKITLAHKYFSDVIWHKSIFSLVRSSPRGSYMSDQVKIILEHNAAWHNHVDIFRAKSKIVLTGVCSWIRESLMSYLILLILYVLVTVINFFVTSVFG